MPNFKVKKQNALLIAMTSGKRYLSSPAKIRDQHAQKGLTCNYYVLNFLRQRIGKFPPENLTKERRDEKILSAQRKELTALTLQIRVENELVGFIEKVFAINPHLIYPSANNYDEIELNIKGTIRQMGFLQELSKENIGFEYMKNADIVQTFINDYLNHYRTQQNSNPPKNILTYSQFTKMRINNYFIKIYSKFINELNFNFDELYVNFVRNYLPQYINTKFTDLDNKLKVAISQKIYFLLQKKIYNIQTIQRNSFNTIDQLLALLNDIGPIGVPAFIGKEFYPKDAIKLQNFNEITAKCFKPNTYDGTKNNGISHVILIIGAAKKEYTETRDDLIFYIDPTDNHKAGEEVVPYAVSFSNFIARVSFDGCANPNLFKESTTLTKNNAPKNADITKNTSVRTIP